MIYFEGKTLRRWWMECKLLVLAKYFTWRYSSKIEILVAVISSHTLPFYAFIWCLFWICISSIISWCRSNPRRCTWSSRVPRCLFASFHIDPLHICFVFYLCFVLPTQQRGGVTDGMEWGLTCGNLVTGSLPLSPTSFTLHGVLIRFTILNLEYDTYSRIISLTQHIYSHWTLTTLTITRWSTTLASFP